MPLGPRRELSLLLHHLGRRFDSSIPTGDRRLAAATTLDLVLRQQVGAVQLLFAIDNVGNTRSEETIGTPLPARRLRLSLHWPWP
jgi:iron complex outermembrane receptor protein/vitamin B12 transporter